MCSETQSYLATCHIAQQQHLMQWALQINQIIAELTNDLDTEKEERPYIISIFQYFHSVDKQPLKTFSNNV